KAQTNSWPFATNLTTSPRSTVIQRVLASMTTVRCAADVCAGLPNMSAWVTLAVAARLAAERVSAAATGTNNLMAFPLKWDAATPGGNGIQPGQASTLEGRFEHGPDRPITFLSFSAIRA